MELAENDRLPVEAALELGHTGPETVQGIAYAFGARHQVHILHNFDQMVPILHVNCAGSVDIDNLD